MANGENPSSGGTSPLWYAVGALIVVVVLMAALVTFKPLEFKPVGGCEDACDRSAPTTSHAAPPSEAPPPAPQ